MYEIDKVRAAAAVASGLAERGHGNQQFLRDIREGRRDGGPFMVGALIWAQVQVMAPAK